ncbi:hypothetical protein [Rhodanobacter sp. MP7CTX1]|uniref:P-loop ATPase, Sll1717 family n=1 Tax=Rhodanobacter sp. MP7CTX1 TaxID=2723084 RepID=UPI00184EC7F5|nr:hypothetical protein [Rhodanobacter sp. MP7CTX1]MBB6189548.1 hypothetical protein [Rhodanobacter sp. MP7CTX1]
MTGQQDVLAGAGFGSRIAEEELDHLRSYFVETEQWRKLLSGEVDIVFGAKGAGKSALYSLLVEKEPELRLGRRTVFIRAENPRGATAFRDLITIPPLSEESLRALWKLYFLATAAHYLRHHLTASKTSNANAAQVIEVLSANGLLAQNHTLVSRLKAVYEYIWKYIPSIETTVEDPHSGYKYTGKITLAEPTSEQHGLGYRSLDALLETLNLAFRQVSITVWLVLDRLDVAFADSDILEGNALRALFRTYLDMLGLSHIKVKIFLRDDIWRKIVANGFREASHITRTLTLSWTSQSLLNLIVRRLTVNEALCAYYGVTKDEILATVELQNEFFYKVFPTQIDIGASKPKTLEWMLSRTADGSKRTAPRELIHLLVAARDEQLKMYELGNSEPEAFALFTNSAIRSALPIVSKARYDQTLCAENPSLKPYLERLERKKAQQSLDSLALLWNCSVDESSKTAEKLVEAGFFERRGTRLSPVYWVPMLYRAGKRKGQRRLVTDELGQAEDIVERVGEGEDAHSQGRQRRTDCQIRRYLGAPGLR